MPFYHVGSNEIALKKGLTQEDYLAALDESFDPTNPNKDQTIFVFNSLEDAKQAALWGRDKKDKNHVPVFVVDLAKKAKKTKGDYELRFEDENEAPQILKGFDVKETDVTLTEVGFPHLNKANIELQFGAPEESNNEDEEASASNDEEVEVKAKDNKAGKKAAEEGENAEKPEANKLGFLSKISALVKSYWPHVAFPTAIGAGAQVGGLVPSIASQLPTALTAMLPAGLAGSSIVAGLAGVAAYVAGYAAYSLANKAYSAYKTSKRTDKQKHDDEVASLETKVTELEKALGLKDDNSIVLNFAKRVERAKDDTFKEDGKLDKAAPENRGKLHVLRWEVAKLQAAKAAPKDEDREELLSKAKKSRGLSA